MIDTINCTLEKTDDFLNFRQLAKCLDYLGLTYTIAFEAMSEEFAYDLLESSWADFVWNFKNGHLDVEKYRAVDLRDSELFITAISKESPLKLKLKGKIELLMLMTALLGGKIDIKDGQVTGIEWPGVVPIIEQFESGKPQYSPNEKEKDLQQIKEYWENNKGRSTEE